jgi:hypothetical protein
MPTTPIPHTSPKAGPQRPLKRAPDAPDETSGGFSQAQDGLPKGQSMTGNEQIDDNLDELGRDINSGDIEPKHHPQAALERGGFKH